VDAIVLLKNDHKTVEKLFKQFEKAGDDALQQKRDLVDQIIEELSVHAYIEEQVFYPEARKAVPETEDHVLESLEEHHIVKWVLEELRGMDPADERFDAKVSVLIENVRHHVEEEEQDWFPKVRKAMGRKRLQELATQLEETKRAAPRTPQPKSQPRS
jgi:hemerythrin superfamily protein